MKRIALLALVAASLCTSARADPTRILFVGTRDLGIRAAGALALQRVAAIQIGAVPQSEALASRLGGLGLMGWTARRRAQRAG